MKNLFKFFSKPDVCTLLVNQDGRHVGLWTKADSVTWFRNFTVQRTGGESPPVSPA